MTIKEAAARYGVSRQAIYQRLKRQGLQVDMLRDPKTGELTPEGEATLSSMFTEAEATEPTTPDNNQAQIDALTAERDALRDQVAQLTSQVDTISAQLATLTDERDFLRRALDQAQQLHAMTLQALPSPRDQTSMMERIRRIFKK
jgi:polyhydroxyalkanoate synthesis regulator phasin